MGFYHQWKKSVQQNSNSFFFWVLLEMLGNHCLKHDWKETCECCTATFLESPSYYNNCLESWEPCLSFLFVLRHLAKWKQQGANWNFQQRHRFTCLVLWTHLYLSMPWYLLLAKNEWMLPTGTCADESLYMMIWLVFNPLALFCMTTVPFA